MSDGSPTPDLDAMAREVLDRIRYIVLGTIDADGRTRTSPVYFQPHRYQDLYWVSHPDTHHSHNLGATTGSAASSSIQPGCRTKPRRST